MKETDVCLCRRLFLDEFHTVLDEQLTRNRLRQTLATKAVNSVVALAAFLTYNVSDAIEVGVTLEDDKFVVAGDVGSTNDVDGALTAGHTLWQRLANGDNQVVTSDVVTIVVGGVNLYLGHPVGSVFERKVIVAAATLVKPRHGGAYKSTAHVVVAALKTIGAYVLAISRHAQHIPAVELVGGEFSLALKVEDKRKGYGLELPNKK